MPKLTSDEHAARCRRTFNSAASQRINQAGNLKPCSLLIDQPLFVRTLRSLNPQEKIATDRVVMVLAHGAPVQRMTR